MGIHVIPVAFHVRAEHRQEALEFVQHMLEGSDDEDLVVTYPNDVPDGEWHFRWVPGQPPEVVSERFTYDPDNPGLEDCG